MDVLQHMTRALSYVEAHLTDVIDPAAVAREAYCSSYNFQRMFAFLADVTLTEYIRRRRMTCAAVELRGGAKVIELAMRYGYDSPVSFARAFRAVHGIPPSAARRPGAVLQAYPPLSFQITLKGDNPMKYRLESKPAFRIFGIEGIFPNSGEGPKPGGLWHRCQTDGTDAAQSDCSYERLFRAAGTPPPVVPAGMCRVHGACGYRATGPDTFPYLLCAFEGADSRTEGYTLAEIPAYTWAVFPSDPFPWEDVGRVIDALYKRFYSEWLPTSGYELADSLDLEVYGGTPTPGGAYIELWYPVKKLP